MAKASTSRLQSSHGDPSQFAGREQLRASSGEFRKEVIEVTNGVFAAVGYSASNVTLIQGRDGSIIVDTSANPVDARAIVEAFGGRRIRRSARFSTRTIIQTIPVGPKCSRAMMLRRSTATNS